MASVTSIAEVRALVTTSLSDVDLQAIIDREEAWLTGLVGPLEGERTVTFRPTYSDGAMYLRRRTTDVALVEDGVALVPDTDYVFTPENGALRRGTVLLPRTWGAIVTATFTPSDLADVKRAVIELVRGSLDETGYDSETIDGYSYTRGESAARTSRSELARSILLRRPAYSTRIRGGWEPAR